MKKILLNIPAKLFLVVVVAGVIWLAFIFSISPRQAWIDGLVEAYFMSSGLVIYKDFVTQYFPLLYIGMLPFHNIFGYGLRPTIALAPISSITAFLLLSIISFKLLKGKFRIIPLLFYMFWSPILSENRFTVTSFQNILLLISFALWWAWYQKPNKSTAFFIGFLLSLSSMSGQIVLLYSAVIFLSMVIKSWEIKKIDIIYYFIAAFLIPLLFVFVWLVTLGALDDFLYRVKWYFASSGYLFGMNRENKNTTFYLAVFYPLVLVSSVILSIRGKKIISRIKQLGLSRSQLFFWWLIILAFPVPIWFIAFYPNRFLAALGIYALTFGLVMQVIVQIKKVKFKAVMLGGFLILAILSVSAVIPKYKRALSYPRPYLNLTAIYPENPQYDIVWWIKQNTTIKDRLFITASSLVYLETHRLPASPRASYNRPIFYRPFEKMLEELKQNPPDYWVIDERRWERFDDFGYQPETTVLKKILSCEKLVFQSGYITIRKHIPDQKLCI